MTGQIRNYNLTIADEEETHFKPPFTEFEPFSDGWINSVDDVLSMVRTIKYLRGKGKKVIVTVFTD